MLSADSNAAWEAQSKWVTLRVGRVLNLADRTVMRRRFEPADHCGAYEPTDARSLRDRLKRGDDQCGARTVRS